MLDEEVVVVVCAVLVSVIVRLRCLWYCGCCRREKGGLFDRESVNQKSLASAALVMHSKAV